MFFKFSSLCLLFSDFVYFLFSFLQIINGKYVEGFYIYARQLLDTSTGSSANTNPLVAAARSSSSNTRSTAASSSALISASKPNIARRDGTPYVMTSSTTPSSVLLSAASYIGSTSYRMLTILNGGGASSCTMTGLLQFTLYEFFIVPFYKSVEGKPSNSRVARTLEDGKFVLSFFSYSYIFQYFIGLFLGGIF